MKKTIYTLLLISGILGIQSATANVLPTAKICTPDPFSIGSFSLDENGTAIVPLDGSCSNDDKLDLWIDSATISGNPTYYGLSYNWTAPGSSIQNGFTNSNTSSITFKAAGWYEITLTVKDNEGEISTDKKTVSITPYQVGYIPTVSNLNNPPIADAGGPYLALVGETVKFYGKATDYDESNTNNQFLQYGWDSGDGCLFTLEYKHPDQDTSDGTFIFVDGDGSLGFRPLNINWDDPSLTTFEYYAIPGTNCISTEKSFSHIYTSSGEKEVSFTVVDKYYGAWDDPSPASISYTTVLVNQRPIASFTSPSSAFVGKDVLFDATNSIDNDYDQLTYNWDFGDGKVGKTVKPSHQYSKAGIYTVILIVDDSHHTSNVYKKIIEVKENNNSAWLVPIISLILN